MYIIRVYCTKNAKNSCQKTTEFASGNKILIAIIQYCMWKVRLNTKFLSTNDDNNNPDTNNDNTSRITMVPRAFIFRQTKKKLRQN